MSQKRKKDVGYVRVSTEYQHTDQQEAAIERYAKEHPELRVTIRKDVISGRKMKGANLQHIKEECTKEEISTLIVYRFDRLGRNLEEMCKFVRECLERGIKVVSTSQSHIDLSTAEGKLGFNIACSFAEFEVHLISDRTKGGLWRAARTCQKCKRFDDKSKTDEGFKCVECGHDTPSFWGGVKKGTKWMSKKTQEKVTEILALRIGSNYAAGAMFDGKMSRKRIAQLLDMDERVVARVIKERDNPPKVRERVWDAD